MHIMQLIHCAQMLVKTPCVQYYDRTKQWHKQFQEKALGTPKERIQTEQTRKEANEA